ncbi:cuticle protein 6-like [Toxorhynchites rutilus septentrionalis]|uniref:cuticle protein 6-like n=1 Tax=Toxorhynchites rutilus septentrionalis TaxID=329112 RepID=UPI002478426B|nr:cuticle protein 6-like [Toxorhynchites rutilus septentrionalis]
MGHDVTSQFHSHDGTGGYSYGYSDPNSQKMEAKDAHGVTHGEYSYVDANGLVQTVKYIADPKHGFQVVGTNLPQTPSHALHKRSVYTAPASYVPFGYYASEQKSWNGPIHIPVIEKGVPVETPEVKHAKAAHAAAHAKVANHAIYVPTAVDEHQAKSVGAWYGPQHVPVIKNGVPIETPEVQHVKAAILSALATASVQSRTYGHEDDGSYKPHLYHNEH